MANKVNSQEIPFNGYSSLSKDEFLRLKCMEIVFDYYKARNISGNDYNALSDLIKRVDCFKHYIEDGEYIESILD